MSKTQKTETLVCLFFVCSNEMNLDNNFSRKYNLRAYKTCFSKFSMGRYTTATTRCECTKYLLFNYFDAVLTKRGKKGGESHKHLYVFTLGCILKGQTTVVLTTLSLNRGVWVPFGWMAKALTAPSRSRLTAPGWNENFGISLA